MEDSFQHPYQAATAVFQALINDVLKEMLTQCVSAYLNDILIFSQSYEDHIQHVRQVLFHQLLNNLFIKLEKSSTSLQSLSWVSSFHMAVYIWIPARFMQSWSVPTLIHWNKFNTSWVLPTFKGDLFEASIPLRNLSQLSPGGLPHSSSGQRRLTRHSNDSNSYLLKHPYWAYQILSYCILSRWTHQMWVWELFCPIERLGTINSVLVPSFSRWLTAAED